MAEWADTRHKFLPYGRQNIDDADIAAVVAALRSDYLTTGPEVEKFERALCSATQSSHAVVCNSGTAALHLAADGLGFGPGDTVIVPAVTFAATANCVAYVGAEVVFADVDPATGLMTAETLKSALEGLSNVARPRGVIVVHLNGQSADMPAIAEVARSHGMQIIEDACHAIGGEQRIGPGADELSPVGACALSDAATFSFHPVKTIAAGEAGALLTRSSELAERAQQFRTHGITRDPDKFVGLDESGAGDDQGPAPWYYEMQALGFNYRVSDVLCALGASQLARLPQFVDTRRSLAARYDELLKDRLYRVQPVTRAPTGNPAWHLYAVHIDLSDTGLTRAALMRRLKDNGIGTQVHYIPVPELPYWRERVGSGPAKRWPGAQRYYASVLSLPMFVGMSNDDVDRVIETLERMLGQD